MPQKQTGVASTPVQPSGEFALIDWIRRQIPPTDRVQIGPGDDTALLRWHGGPGCLITTDMLLEGSCFRLEEAGPFRVGRKAMAVNLSDIAAMAGIPVAAVVSVGLPRQGGRAIAEQLQDGLSAMASSFGVAIIGGDTNSWNGPLVINVTLIGEETKRGSVRRSGAKPGDWIFVTGPLGGSILGKHLDFQPRVREALLLHEKYQLHAMIDISDGLAADLGHLSDESSVGAVLQSDAIPLTAEASKMKDALSPLQHGLSDGEDFELLFTLGPEEGNRLLQEQPLPGLARIGTVLAEPGLWIEYDGQRERLPRTGYVHAFD